MLRTSSTATSSSSSRRDADALLPGHARPPEGCPACREEHDSLRALVESGRRGKQRGYRAQRAGRSRRAAARRARPRVRRKRREDDAGPRLPSTRRQGLARCREVPKTDDLAAAAVDALRQGPTDREGEAGFVTAVPASTDAKLSRLALAQIVYTQSQQLASARPGRGRRRGAIRAPTSRSRRRRSSSSRRSRSRT